ncbi:MAG: S8/S53 family peptidase [Marinobacter sp.]|uniref:S8/S53 family peptidase n=1 Tax=Marinobacter sp. TaxID=50741 RepID=UPI003F9BB758
MGRIFRHLSGCILIASGLWLASVSVVAEELRIAHWEPINTASDSGTKVFSVTARGLESKGVRVMFDNKALPDEQVEHHDGVLTFSVQGHQRSGPLWLEQGKAKSNPVWLSLAKSHVIAANEDEVATNMDGLTTYVDLISVIIEESHDGAEEARRLADKFSARIVGAIPPLNTYQLRLSVTNLVERDALILRLGNEVSVDAVVIEETSAESPRQSQEQESATEPSVSGQDEWTANRFLDAVNYYTRRLSANAKPIKPHPIRVGIIERDVDFDAPDFSGYLGGCRSKKSGTCVYARDAKKPDDHGTTVTGILAAGWENGGNTGFLSGLNKVGSFDVIVERGSDAGITANVAASVNLVQDGVRVLNWSWGVHRIGAVSVDGNEVDSLVRSGLAMSGYEELLEEFFLWLRREHPNVVVVNSAGNASSYSSKDEYRLPSSFITEQLFVVGGHELSEKSGLNISDPGYATKREASNIDMRVDITAAACARGSTPTPGDRGETHCGTSYATPLVTGLLAAMMSINPELAPEQLRMLLRRSAMTISDEHDFEPVGADDLTSPILPSERGNNLNNPDVGHSARLDMQKALDLTVQSLDRVR